MAAETEAPVAPDGPPPTEEAPAATPVRAPKPPQEKAAKGGKGNDEKKKGKDEKKKGKKGKKGEDDNAEDDAVAGGPSVAAHPRASRAVARAKSWGGLLGFLLGGYLSLPTNTVAAAGLRALIAGVVCYVAVWAGAVFLFVFSLKTTGWPTWEGGRVPGGWAEWVTRGAAAGPTTAPARRRRRRPPRRPLARS